MSWHGYAAAGMVTQHPRALDGVWAKMERAAGHYSALSAAIETYLAIPPYLRDETMAGDFVSVRAEATTQPPVELALIFGDMVQNLRSALDHMAWAFARTVKSEPSKRTQFPIFRNRPEDFACEPQVHHIPEPVRAIMEQMQPYATEDAIGHDIGQQLLTLAELSNRDKHRVLLLAEGITVMPKYVTHNTPRGMDSRITFRADPDRQWAEVIHPADPAYGPYTVEFEAEVTIIEPGLPWRSGLDGIAQHLWNEVNITIGAFRGQWPLLASHSSN